MSQGLSYEMCYINILDLLGWPQPPDGGQPNPQSGHEMDTAGSNMLPRKPSSHMETHHHKYEDSGCCMGRVTRNIGGVLLSDMLLNMGGTKSNSKSVLDM